MKKLFSLTLSLLLLMALMTPAGATSTEKRLEKVTRIVKQTLDLNTDDYDDFTGEVSDTWLTSMWSLHWSSEDENLYVDCDKNGVIRRFDRQIIHDELPIVTSRGFAPSFPKLSRDEAWNVVEEFFDKVLLQGERMEKPNNTGTLSVSTQNFRGTLTMNGLPSPLSCSVTVDGETKQVVSFCRDLPCAYVDGVPSNRTKTDKSKAATLLDTTRTMELNYVCSEDSEKAELRYVPADRHDYYVDAKTGKLVDLTGLYDLKGSRSNGVTDLITADGAISEKSTLTEVEQAGADLLKDVCSKTELDDTARAIKGLGLHGLTLTETNYTVRTETDESKTVFANLRYFAKKDDGSYSATVVLNAKTGALESVNSWRPTDENAPTISAENARQKADDFLKVNCSDYYKQLELRDSQTAGEKKWLTSHSFIYTRKVNDVFFPANSFRVSIDSKDGTVRNFSYTYDKEVVFQQTDGIVTAKAAQGVYSAAFDTVLKYLAVPEKKDDRFYSRLVLAYVPETNGWVEGVNAKTGDIIQNNSISTDKPIVYDDLDGSPARKQAEALAAYGVGFLGGKLQGSEPLTQKDMVALLLSGLQPRPIPLNTPERVDELYEQAYWRGIVVKGDRNEDKAITRMELISLLIDGMGYGEVAQLSGIYHTSFADASAIPKDQMGYAALAQGFGIVHGDRTGRLNPGCTALRQDAIFMLYNFMAR